MILFNHLNAPHLPIHTDSPPAIIDEATADTIYICWEEDEDVVQHIEKTIEVAGKTTVGFAKGTYTGRAALTYVAYHSYDPEA